MNSLEVEELGLARLGYKIKFYFGRNPYFQNKVLIKEYGCGPSGQVVSRSTPIQWLPGHDLQTLSQGNPDNSRSFFGWFSNHSSIESAARLFSPWDSPGKNTGVDCHAFLQGIFPGGRIPGFRD